MSVIFVFLLCLVTPLFAQASNQSASTQSTGEFHSYNGVMRSSSGLSNQAFEMGDVQLQSGKIFFTETDLKLPGKNGMDLTLGRIYDSSRYTEIGGVRVAKKSTFIAKEIRKQAGNGSAHGNGVGSVIFDIDGNGKPDIYRVRVDDWRSDMLLYEIGWNLDQTGEPERWGTPVHIGDEIGRCEGAGVTAVDLDGNGRKEIIVVVIDDLVNASNIAYYRIGWNINAAGTVSRWSNYSPLPAALWTNTHDVGLTHADVNRNGRPELIISFTEDNTRPYRSYMLIGWDLDTNGRIHSTSAPIPILFEDTMFGSAIVAADFNGNGVTDLLLPFMKEGERELANLYYKIAWDMDEEGVIKGWSPEIKSDIGFGVNDNWRYGYANRSGTGGEWSGGIGADVVDLDQDGSLELMVSMLDNMESNHLKKMRTIVTPVYTPSHSSREWSGLMGAGWRWTLASRAIATTRLKDQDTPDQVESRILIESGGGMARFDVNQNDGWFGSKIPGENGRARFNTSSREVVYEDGQGKRYVFAEETYREGIPLDANNPSPFIGVYYLSRTEDAFGNSIQMTYERYESAYEGYTGYFDGAVGTSDDWKSWITAVQKDLRKNQASTVTRMRPRMIRDTFGREVKIIYEGDSELTRFSENVEPNTPAWKQGQAKNQLNRQEIIRGILYKNQDGADRLIRYRYDASGALAGVKEEGLPEATYGYETFIPTYKNRVATKGNTESSIGIFDVTEVPYDALHWEEPAWEMRGKILNKRKSTLGAEIRYRYEEQLTNQHIETWQVNMRYDFVPQDSFPVVIQKSIVESPGAGETSEDYQFTYYGYRLSPPTSPNPGRNGSPKRNKKYGYRVSYLPYDVWLFSFNIVEVIPPQGLPVEIYTYEYGKLKKKKITGKTNGVTVIHETENSWAINLNQIQSGITKLNGVVQSQQIFESYDSYGRVTKMTQKMGLLGAPDYLESVIETSYAAPGMLPNFGLMAQEKETRKEGSIEQSVLKINVFNDRGSVVENYMTASGPGLSVGTQKRSHMTYAYDSAGRVSRVTAIDALGGPLSKEMSYHYDSQGYLITERLVGSGKQTQILLDPYTGKMKESTDTNGQLLRRRYDAMGRLTEEILPDNTQKTWRYSADLKEVTEAYEGRSVRKVSDALGRLWLIDNPTGEEDQAFDYGVNSRLTATYSGQAATNTWVGRTRYLHDNFGRVVIDDIPGIGATTYTYNDVAKEVIVEGPDGRKTGKKQDSRGQLISQWESVSNTFGTPGSGYVQTQNSGNPAGKLEQRYTYDMWGNAIDTKDEKGRLWSSNYTLFKELSQSNKSRLPGESATAKNRVERDNNGNITRLQLLDDMGALYKELTYQYDSEGRVTATLIGGVVVEEIVYDFGLEGETNTKGRIGKITQIDPEITGPNASASYTTITEYAYDIFGRTTREKTTIKDTKNSSILQSHEMKTRYANHGGISEIEYPDGKKITYTYTLQNRRLSSIQYDGKTIANYAYNTNGTLSQMQMGNGLTHDYSYDQTHVNRKHLLTQLKSRNRANNEVYYEQNNTYDSLGRMTQIEYKDPIMNRRKPNVSPQHEVALIKKNYRYTERHELMAIDLTTEKYTNTPTNLNAVMSLSDIKSRGGSPVRETRSNYYRYDYDEVGNALTYSHVSASQRSATQAEQTTRQIHRLKDELTSQTYSDGRAISMSYDVEGNLVRKVRTYPNASPYQTQTFKSTNNRQNSKTQTTDYSYDPWNRLKSVTVSGEGKKGTYVYNHKNQRVLEVLPQETNHQRFGTGIKVTYWSSQGQAIGEGYVGNQSNYTVRYIYSGNQKIAMIRPDKNGFEKVFYFINNVQGTPVIIMDEAGTMVSKIRMDDWGNVAAIQGQQSEINFTGKKLDVETGLYYFNQRYYDPETGRFFSHDPANQTINPYQYCGNNPILFIDRDGRAFGWDDFAMAVISAAVINAGINMSMQYLKTGDVDWTSVGQAALAGAVSGGLGYGIGAVLGHGFVSYSRFATKTLAHGVSNGVQSAMFGGDFNSGFASGAIGHISGHLGGGDLGKGTAYAAIGGGIASSATGGSFMDGAVRGAFVNMYNQAWDSLESMFRFIFERSVGVQPEEYVQLVQKTAAENVDVGVEGSVGPGKIGYGLQGGGVGLQGSTSVVGLNAYMEIGQSTYGATGGIGIFSARVGFDKNSSFPTSLGVGAGFSWPPLKFSLSGDLKLGDL